MARACAGTESGKRSAEMTTLVSSSTRLTKRGPGPRRRAMARPHRSRPPVARHEPQPATHVRRHGDLTVGRHFAKVHGVPSILEIHGIPITPGDGMRVRRAPRHRDYPRTADTGRGQPTERAPCGVVVEVGQPDRTVRDRILFHAPDLRSIRGQPKDEAEVAWLIAARQVADAQPCGTG